jgi:hypothetical protein
MRQSNEGKHQYSPRIQFLLMRERKRQIQPSAPQTEVEQDDFVLLDQKVFHAKFKLA